MTDRQTLPPADPARIGPYKLLKLLGEGGMGEVWLAEQSEPVHRRVALKILKLGMDTKLVVARFEAERQALAVMEHPGIAHVFDGGATEDGRPYFVMELVPGVPITEYCDTHRLTTDERLRLFVQVCEAVQHAHHKGVIHRDLKPSNVLVMVNENEPLVKVIDFGIAKALGHELTERTLVTRMGQIVGTPEYMSPEQAEVSTLDVDTRSDVYSLGVMLYEILVGALPFDFSARAENVIRHAIRETEVPKPSTKLTSMGESGDTVALYRRTTVEALRRELRSDLDWIILKAMDKDRTRRYETANGLAEDINRHLRLEPVQAHAPSTRYRVRKFVKRHRVGVAFAAAFVTLLTASVLGVGIQNTRIARERDRAELEAEAARQVSDFLVEAFKVTDPSEARGNTVTAREILDKGANRIERDLAGQPVVQGRLMDVMGVVYLGLGLYEEANPLLEEAVRIRRTALGNEDLEVAWSLHNLADLYQHQFRLDEALAAVQEALDIRRAVLGPRDTLSARSLQLLGQIQRGRGEFASAREALEESLDIFTGALGDRSIAVAWCLWDLGWLAYQEGDLEGARRLYEEAVPILEAGLGPDHPDLAGVLQNLANILAGFGDYDEARALFARTIHILEATLGDNHPLLANAHNDLGNFHWRMGNLPGAIAQYDTALGIREAAFAPGHISTAPVLMNLGLAYQSVGDYAQAREYYTRALRIQDGEYGPDHPNSRNTLNNLGYLLRYIGDFEAGVPILERAIQVTEGALGPESFELTYPLQNLGMLYRDQGDLSAARRVFQRRIEINEKVPGPNQEALVQALTNLGEILILQGEISRADSVLERAQTIFEGESASEGYLREIFYQQGKLRRAQGDLPASDSLFQAALSLIESTHGAESGNYLLTEVRIWGAKGDREQALEAMRRAVESGYEDPWLLRMPEIAFLRGDPEFEVMADRIRRQLAPALAVR